MVNHRHGKAVKAVANTEVHNKRISSKIHVITRQKLIAALFHTCLSKLCNDTEEQGSDCVWIVLYLT